MNGIHLEKDNKNAGVQHEGNVTELRIEFDAGWDAFAKTVTFWNALMANPVKRVIGIDLLEDVKTSTRVYIVPIPPEAMTEAGMMSFVIDGFIEGKRKRSVKGELNVIAAPYAEEAEEPTDPTPSQAEQLQVQIDAFKDDLQQYAQTASAGATSASASASEAKAHAEQAKQSAEQAEKYLLDIQNGGFATDSNARMYASQAEANAKAYTDEVSAGKASSLYVEEQVSLLLKSIDDVRGIAERADVYSGTVLTERVVVLETQLPQTNETALMAYQASQRAEEGLHNLTQDVGNIGAVLDELHAYAQGFIGGGEQ